MVNASEFNRRTMTESLRFLFLFDRTLSPLEYFELTLRQTTQISLGIELFGIAKVIMAISLCNYSWRSAMPQTVLAIFGIIQFIATLVLFIFSFVKNDFKKFYFSHAVYTILFLIGLFISIIFAILEMIFDYFQITYLIVYIMYYILSYNITFIVFVFTKQLSNIGHTDSVYSLSKLYETSIVSGSSDNSIKIWNVNSVDCLKTLVGHKDCIRCLLNINENTIVSGSSDYSLKSWDLETGKCLITFLGHTNAIFSLITINETTIASGSSDRSIKTWNIIQEHV